MARPRAYAIADVLEAAMEEFWRRGFVATSMADIYAATGLKPGNLYATFKDKDSLFRQAFEAYAVRFRATLPTDREGRAAIAAWLDIQAALAIEDPERRGCLIINTIIEREAHSPETRALAESRMAEIRAFFARHVALAAASGELAAGTDEARLTDALVGAVVAIMSLGRAGADAIMIRHVADQARVMAGG